MVVRTLKSAALPNVLLSYFEGGFGGNSMGFMQLDAKKHGRVFFLFFFSQGAPFMVGKQLFTESMPGFRLVIITWSVDRGVFARFCTTKPSIMTCARSLQ